MCGRLFESYFDFFYLFSKTTALKYEFLFSMNRTVLKSFPALVATSKFFFILIFDFLIFDRFVNIFEFSRKLTCQI